MARSWILWVVLGALAALRPELYLYVKRALAIVSKVFSPRPWLFYIGVGSAVLLTRLALLPFNDIPRPVIHDEFAYILQADTFAHGRLTNPAPKHPEFFEAEQILVRPTYNGKYFPAQPLFMALGQVLFGHPWYGVWLSCGLMAVALLWAVGGWLPFRWVVLSAAVVYPLATFSYWMDSYWGGSVTALGGGLVLGAYPRRNGWMLGLGAAILVLSRPYDAMAVLIPVGISLLWKKVDWKILSPATVVVGVALGWFAYNNAAVTGNPARPAYAEWTSQYAVVPALTILPPLPPKNFAHEILKMNYRGWEIDRFERAKTLPFFWKYRPQEWFEAGSKLLVDPVLLFVTLLSLLWAWKIKSARLPLLTVMLWLASSLVVYACFAHYASPVTASLLILSVTSFRLLCLIRWPQRVTGRFLAYVLPLVILINGAGKPVLLALRTKSPYDMKPAIVQKDRVTNSLLDSDPGPHIVFVHYSGFLIPHAEWVYNTANIAAQEVIWAQDMGPDKNRTLMRDYPGRKYWLFDPDQSLDTFTPIAAP